MPPMDRTAVVSSNVESVGYDPEHQVVEVEFRGGRVYHYFDVDQEMWDAREEYDSIGKWVAGPLKGNHSVEPGEFEPEDEEPEEGSDMPTDDQIRDDEAQVEGDPDV